MDVLALLAPVHDAAGVELGSPPGYVVMCLFWALVWSAVSFLSLEFLTPRGLPNVPDEKRWQWARAVASSLHAALTALLACYYLMSGEIDLWDHFEAPHPVWEQLVCVSLGYFFMDFIQICVLKPTPSDFCESIFHHVLTLYVHFVPVCVFHGFVNLSMVGYLAELSTPSVNIRWFMLKADLTSHPFYLVNGAAMVLTFFVFRIVTGLWLLYATIYLVHFAPEENSCSLFTAKMGVVGYVLGPLVCLFYGLWCYWFSLIVEGIKAAFAGEKFENDPDSDAEEEPAYAKKD